MANVLENKSLTFVLSCHSPMSARRVKNVFWIWRWVKWRMFLKFLLLRFSLFIFLSLSILRFTHTMFCFVSCYRHLTFCSERNQRTNENAPCDAFCRKDVPARRWWLLLFLSFLPDRPSIYVSTYLSISAVALDLPSLPHVPAPLSTNKQTNAFCFVEFQSSTNT